MGNSDIHSVPTVRNLGSWFDSRLSMSKHITKICGFFIFVFVQHTAHQQLSHKRKPRHSFIHSYPVILTTATAYYMACLSSLSKLQRVQNACARLIFNEHKFCHTTPLIVELHWLPIRFRIVYFKILLITFKILYGLALCYLSCLISFRRPSRYNRRNSNDNLLLSYPSFISKLATLGDRSVLHLRCFRGVGVL